MSELRARILKTIQVLGHDAYGYKIAKITSEQTGRFQDPSAVSQEVKALLKKGFIEVSETRAGAGRRGPPANILRLTEEGRNLLERAKDYYRASANYLRSDSDGVVVNDFNPEKLAPSFLSYLKKYGEVTFGQSEKIMGEGSISPGSTRSDHVPIAVKKSVKVGDRPIGELILRFQLPRSLSFEGDVPLPESTTPDDVIWREAKLNYSYGLTDGGTGAKRADNWNSIPFP